MIHQDRNHLACDSPLFVLFQPTILLQVNKNAFLLKSIDELFLRGKDEVNHSALKELMQKVLVNRFLPPLISDSIYLL